MTEAGRQLLLWAFALGIYIPGVISCWYVILRHMRAYDEPWLDQNFWLDEGPFGWGISGCVVIAAISVFPVGNLVLALGWFGWYSGAKHRDHSMTQVEYEAKGIHHG